MRLLCLHGRRQSASVLREKLLGREIAACAGESAAGGLLLAESPRLGRLAFLDAPFVSATSGLPEHAAAKNVPCAMYSWWDAAAEDACLEQRRVSAQRVCDSWAREEYDGLVGFSQGGALLAHLVLTGMIRPRFCVLMSAYAGLKPSRASPKVLQGDFPTIPSLHIYGSSDQVVRPSFSSELCVAMGGRAHVLEGSGHSVPAPPFAEQVIGGWLLATLDSVGQRNRPA